MTGPPGFSTLHVSRTDSPGLIDAGFASKLMMRGAGAGPRPPPRAGAGGAPGAAGGACGVCADTAAHASTNATPARNVRLTVDLLRADFAAVGQLHAVGDH